VVSVRQKLQSQSALGFIGAQTIAQELQSLLPSQARPSPRTIGRILKRQGLLDHQTRRRLPPPPPGWYLPLASQRQAELDCFDVIEDLALEGHGPIHVLTAKALWGPALQAWLAPSVSANFVARQLIAHWRAEGCPLYAQFDNDTRFQGPHNRPQVLGRVIRLCLALEIIPVFAPPRETGFQALIESFNNLWQKKVWHRFHHENPQALAQRSARFLAAYHQHLAPRLEGAPARRPFPAHWQLDLQTPLRGKAIFLRRTNALGQARVLEQNFHVDPTWVHRLLRCEVDFTHNAIGFYRLRRRDPADQPLLKTVPFHLKQCPFRE
jgi:hypothetical protein